MEHDSFYAGKQVFVTGHTGFKGAWLCKMLLSLGAKVTGYALPETTPSLYALAGIEPHIHSVIGDVRDLDSLKRALLLAQPEIVFHLAAQPLVQEGYKNPVETYSTNVMGTVHLLEAVRECGSVCSVVNVTTDKVYRNNEWEWGYREQDALDGYDPYSNSKSCAELVTASYVRSFFPLGIAISTVRAGNVIGGGDFAANRILPDCVRAMQRNVPIIVRNPYAVRPYQFVLEALRAYLLLAQCQYKKRSIAGAYNIGPKEEDCVTTGTLVQMFCDTWGKEADWQDVSRGSRPMHEVALLKLDSSKIKAKLGFVPRCNIQTAVENTVAWYRAFLENGTLIPLMEQQIAACMEEQSHV